MLAFFSIVVEQDGSYSLADGSLHNPPPELRDRYRVNQYLAIKKEGWSVSEFGYLCLKKTDKFGRKYLFPGHILEDGPKPTKKFLGYKAQFSKQQIEYYVQAHLERNDKLRTEAEQELTTLVHDLRHLSTAIYHSAEQAGRAFRENDRSELSDGLKTIVATQTMLKARTDYLDYVSGVDSFETLEKIPVYSRVDKVVKCFKAAARDKNINLKLHGESFRLTRGPNILDIVPYTLIDNAIKYSPPHNDIQVQVYDIENKTIVSVSSIGPVLEESEDERIFDRGFRGRNASLVRSAGTGIGLSVAKEIIEEFSGEISVQGSGTVRAVDGIDYHEVEFKFMVPSSGEDKSRRQRSGRGRST
ncbi:MAG: HAMP domain-containing histidine kinase [Hyphomicrobiales bacterium]|nr:HAMP domain-containing histidine kinase [Hyphomicrobiales bacterium]